jgi:hypothetical protein
MSATDAILQQVTDNLDSRRFEITNLRRLVLRHVHQPLETTAVQMAIPMIYAHWEGYVKEVSQLYLEHIESSVECCGKLHPALLGYLWTPVLRPLTNGINFERRMAVVEHVLQSLASPVAFSDAEKTIETKSNLNYSVLQTIASSLRLDIGTLEVWKGHLNALVHLRNNIAHGSPAKSLGYSDFDNHASSTLALMEGFEEIVVSAISSRAFCSS